MLPVSERLLGLGVSAMQFEGRQVVITGGSSGIGKAIAREFLRRGSHVHLLARRRALIDQAIAELRDTRLDESQRCAGDSCDVSDPVQVEQAFDRLRRSGHPPSVLINSAGIARPGYVEELPVDAFEQALRINYLGTVHAVKAILPDLLRQGEGLIVNIGSLAGLIGLYGYTAYCGSKFAVTGFTQSLRSELQRKGIQVCLLCPPDTDTPQLAAENRNKPPETKRLAGSAGLLSPDAVARALLRGVERNRALVIPGVRSRGIVWLQRVAPGFFEWVIERKLRRLASGRA